MKQFSNQATLAALTFAVGLLSCLAAETEPGRPNIIIVLADDLGYGDLSSYGQRLFDTPNIDSLAADGLKMTDHYAGSAVCAPSRCALLTGLHTGNCRIRANFGLGAGNQRIRVSLEDEDITVAEVLRAAGYRTGLFGKWGLGEAGTAGVPWQQGFDRFSGFLNQANAHNHYPPAYWQGTTEVPIPENVNDSADDDVYIDDVLIEDAVRFIRDNAEIRFFMLYSPLLPHSDMTVPEDSIQEFRGRFPAVTYEEEHYIQEDVRAAYAAMVTRLDGYVGRLIDALAEEGIANRTVLVFVSDNGPHSSDGNDPEFFSSSGPFRGQKSSLYEGGIRVPMLVRWPDAVSAGRESGFVCAFWDFLPTLAEIAGVNEEIETDGTSMVDAMIGKDTSNTERVLYWEYGHRRMGGQQALRRGEIKAYRRNPDEPIEIYDLSKDVAESTDISARHPGLIDEFDELFDTMRTDDPSYPLIIEAPDS